MSSCQGFFFFYLTIHVFHILRLIIYKWVSYGIEKKQDYPQYLLLIERERERNGDFLCGLEF